MSGLARIAARGRQPQVSLWRINRQCKHYWTVAADAYVREALQSLPEGKEILYSSLGETVVLVATGKSALDLWYEWMKPRLVEAYMTEVRTAYEQEAGGA